MRLLSVFFTLLFCVLSMSCPDPNNKTDPSQRMPKLLDKVLILQAYGTGDSTDGGVSHSFIELYNKSDETADLTGYSLQYSTGGTSWRVIRLDGKTIPARHSFLILGMKMNGRDPDGIWGLLQLNEADADMRFPDFQMSNRSFKIFLVESSVPVRIRNPHDINGNKTGVRYEGYVDLLGVNDNDETADIDAFETNTLGIAGLKGPFFISKGKSARRINLTDTDDNSRDFQRIEWRQRFGDAESLSTADFEALRPRSSKDGEWNPVYPLQPLGNNNANIGSLIIGGKSAGIGTPGADPLSIRSPGMVEISSLVAGSAAVQINAAPGAGFRTAVSAEAGGTPRWDSILSPAYSFADGSFLYVEVTSANGRNINVYKIAVSVYPVADTVTVSGTYTLLLNPGANPQNRVVIEAYSTESATVGTLAASARADMTDKIWSLAVPRGQAIWFKVAVTDVTGYSFGKVVSLSAETYTSDTSGISLTLGPFAPPELVSFTLINATADNGIRQNKTANTIDQTSGEIIFGDTNFTTISVNTIINFHALAANFTLSPDSKIYTGNISNLTEQISGITTNNYNRDVVFTVVSGDNVRKTYRVAGSKPIPGVDLPGVRSVVGTTNFQTQGFGIMNIETVNKTLGLPTGETGKLNIVWNPTGSYTYISPEGRVQTGGTDIKARGNHTVRFEDPKSFSLTLNTAAGFDYYDYKTNSFRTLPSNRRWALLINSGDNGGTGSTHGATRIKASVCYEMGRRILTDMGWQPHTDWVFVFLNGNYQGLYMLVERIRISEGRVNIGPTASMSNPNGGFIVQMNNIYWYTDDLSPHNGSSNLVFDEMYNFMTSHQRSNTGIVWSFDSPGSDIGWYYQDPPDGDGYLDYSDIDHFPRKGIAMRATLASGSEYNRPSDGPANWIVPNEFGETNGMGTPRMKNGGLYGDRTLPEVYPDWESSTFVKMSKFIQDAEDAIYSHDWVDKGYGNGSYLDYIDIDSFIDWHIAHEMALDWEVNGLNGRYMHYDPVNEKLKMGPMWDMDKTFEITNNYGRISPGFLRNSNFWYREILGSNLSSSLRDPYYISRLKDRWNEVKDKFNAELDPYIDAQNARFSRISSYSHPTGMRVDGNRMNIKGFLTTIRNQLDPIINSY